MAFFFLSSLFVIISPSFGASGMLCLVIEAFPGYLHLFLVCRKANRKSPEVVSLVKHGRK